MNTKHLSCSVDVTNLGRQGPQTQVLLFLYSLREGYRFWTVCPSEGRHIIFELSVRPSVIPSHHIPSGALSSYSDSLVWPFSGNEAFRINLSFLWLLRFILQWRDVKPWRQHEIVLSWLSNCKATRANTVQLTNVRVVPKATTWHSLWLKWNMLQSRLTCSRHGLPASQIIRCNNDVCVGSYC